MANLVVDIETVPDFDSERYFEVKKQVDSGELSMTSGDKSLFWKFQSGALMPIEGRVSLITYSINNANIVRLKEWELGEREILRKFYHTIKDLNRGRSDRLKIIGHNILGFDLFFLYIRMRHHKIEEEKWLYKQLMDKPEVVDLLQLHLPLNDYKIRGLKHDVLAHAYGFPTKSTIGSEEILHYFEKKYHKILEYSEREFIYPELFAKIQSEGLVSRETLQESIRYYDELHGRSESSPR